MEKQKNTPAKIVITANGAATTAVVFAARLAARANCRWLNRFGCMNRSISKKSLQIASLVVFR